MRLVDVSSLLFVASHQPLFCHNLQEFEDGGVSRRPLFVEGFLHLADGAGTALPEHSQYCEFSVGWPWRTTLSHVFIPQWPHPTTKDFVVSTKFFVESCRG